MPNASEFFGIFSICLVNDLHDDLLLCSVHLREKGEILFCCFYSGSCGLVCFVKKNGNDNNNQILNLLRKIPRVSPLCSVTAVASGIFPRGFCGWLNTKMRSEI